MRALPQLIIVVLIGAVSIPLSARFVPGSRPWLDRIGLLQPLVTVGIVPTDAPDAAGGQGPEKAKSRGVSVVASPLKTEAMRDVISAIGSARGAQAANLSFECSQLVNDWWPFYVERLSTVSAPDPTSSKFVREAGIVHSAAFWALMYHWLLNRNNYAITAQLSAVMVGPWTIHVLLAHVADAVFF